MESQKIEIIVNSEEINAKLEQINRRQEEILQTQKQILENIQSQPNPAPEPIPSPAPEPTPEPIPSPAPEPTPPANSVNILELGIEPIDSQIGNLPFRGCLYGDKKKDSGDGFWIAYGAEPQIVKVENGIEKIEKAKSWIGKAEFNELNLADKNIFFPLGTYILLQGDGVNPFWYQKTKSIKGDAVLIGIKNYNAPGFNKIATKVEGLKLQNIILDYTPDITQHIISKNTIINLDDLQSYLNPITGLSLDANIDLDGVKINSKARIRAGVFIDHAKDVRIKNCLISAKYADNGIRISNASGFCEITNNTTGEGFNTGIQASSNREALSLGFNFQENEIIKVLEESLGFDSYANNLGLVPVIATSTIGAVGTDSVDLETLYFIDEITTGIAYGKKIVDASFVGIAKNYELVIQSGPRNYSTYKIEKFEVIEEGKTLRLFAENITQELNGAEVAICSGFKNCKIEGNTIKGFIPDTGQPAHGISLWGGGFYNLIKNNIVTGSKNGIQLASLGAFGVSEFFCHAIGNTVENNQFINCQSAIRITSEYSDRLGSKNRLISNRVLRGEILINNQIDFEMAGNDFEENTILIENVSGTFSGGRLIDTQVTIKNSPNLKIENVELIGNSKINYI
jgi:hypothetical protein